jgi:hypothetical protein
MIMNKVKSSLLKVLYIVVTGILTLNIIFTAILLLSYDSGDSTSPLIGFSVLTVISGFFSWKFNKTYKASKDDDIDNTILKIAMAHQGLITAVELASDTRYSLTEAAEHLERNYQAGFCDKKFTQETLVEVYHFKQAISSTEKMSAVNVSELNS